mmetsp:Transcript_27444/g.45384  ORF Transcript_27444/g.45384 Transcript_27444/m.45384 type:complete len:285 (+) Transcript_27444:502-1356(+)
MVGLGGSSAMEIVELSDGVWSLKDFNLGLDGTFSEITRPEDHLYAFYGIWDIEIPDGSASSFGGSTLDDGFGTGIKDGLGCLPGLFEFDHVWNFCPKFEGELVGTFCGNLEGFGARFEFEHGPVGRHGAILVFDIDGMDSTNGSDPQLYEGLERTSIGSNVVIQAFRFGRNIPSSDGSAALHFAHGNVHGKHVCQDHVDVVIGGGRRRRQSSGRGVVARAGNRVNGLMESLALASAGNTRAGGAHGHKGLRRRKGSPETRQGHQQQFTGGRQRLHWDCMLCDVC